MEYALPLSVRLSAVTVTFPNRTHNHSAMGAAERLVRTWMGSGRDTEIQETVSGMDNILRDLCVQLRIFFDRHYKWRDHIA